MLSTAASTISAFNGRQAHLGRPLDTLSLRPEPTAMHRTVPALLGPVPADTPFRCGHSALILVTLPDASLYTATGLPVTEFKTPPESRPRSSMSAMSDCTMRLYCALTCKPLATIDGADLTMGPIRLGEYVLTHGFSSPVISSAMSRPAKAPFVKPLPESPVTTNTFFCPWLRPTMPSES